MAFRPPRGAALLAAVLLHSIVALADTTLSGELGDGPPHPGGGGTKVRFSCVGAPTCVGISSITHRSSDCSNSITFDADLTLSGIDVSHAGTLAGTVSISKTQDDALHNSNGSCTYILGGGLVLNYTASWNGTSGTIDVSGTDSFGDPVQASGTFTATVTGAPAVFPMAVSGSITATSSSVSAQIQPRAQDQGTTQSVFVFAHAPASAVKSAVAAKRVSAPPFGAVEKDSVVCVLAQVGSDGQLHAVSASTMQAYLTGVLSAQGQAVSILNAVSTPNVAGASLFVGYGPSAAAMLSSGVYQAAVNIPGGVQCTASLASAPAPQSPGALSGLWWNANESGWGIHFTQRRNVLFAAWYTYDAVGGPKWYVASGCALPSGNTGVTGTCTGDLYEVSGPTFFGAPFDGSLAHVATAGTLQATFQDANHGSMTYTVGTQTRTLAIERQIFRTGATPAVDYTDLWWNPGESGWGMAMSHQYDVMFLAWFVYDGSGKPVWYVAPACAVNGSSCAGSLYRTTGPALGPSFNPLQVQAFEVGSAIVSFIDANNAVLSYTVNGVGATKTIKRQVF